MLLALVALPLAVGSKPRAATPAWAALDLPASLERLLATGRWDRTPRSFRIIALSLLADSCADQGREDPSLTRGAAACVARCLTLARRTRPRGLKVAKVRHGLWLSHYNLILGAHDQVADCANPDEHRQVATALARRSLHEPTRHVPSYPRVPYRWPADQTATLASLARYDRGHGTHLAVEPARQWLAYLREHATDARLGLPWSEATGRSKGAHDPRGCALSFQTLYLSEVDLPTAQEWWRRYRRHFFVDRLLLVGFREWPRGRERPADVDSGPLVQGVGAAATALAIPAARRMGNRFLARRLEATASVVGQVARRSRRLRRHSETILADAIRARGQTARPAPPTSRPAPTSPAR